MPRTFVGIAELNGKDRCALINIPFPQLPVQYAAMPEPPSEQMVTVLWLLPAGPALGALRGLVARLAKECDAPVFEPHLTLGPGSPKLPQDVACEPLRLRTAEFGFTDQFTKTLFVRLECSEELRTLRHSLGMETSGAFDPHISLLYAQLNEERRAQLARSIAFPFASILFDSLAVVRCPDPTTSRADVDSWEVVASQRLL